MQIKKRQSESILNSTIILKKLSSLLMRNGKKKVIFKAVLKTLQNFHDEGFKNNKSLTYFLPIKDFCLLTAMFHRIKPILETRKVRKGSKYYDVPFPMKKSRSLSLLLRWVVRSIRKQPSANLTLSIKNEFKNLWAGAGLTVRESKALRNKVSTNVMYSHYRWR